MDEDHNLRLTALSIANAARLLQVAGAPGADESSLREHLARGAPANADGTINLVHFAAWLAKELGRGRA